MSKRKKNLQTLKHLRSCKVNPRKHLPFTRARKNLFEEKSSFLGKRIVLAKALRSDILILV